MFQAFIIDDDRVAVEATYKLFPWEKLNITQIEKIYSPTGVVKRILDEKPHVVFIDIEMGDISGLDIIRECKEHASDSLFVIISGHDEFNYAHAAVNLGAVHYLLKPIDLSDIDILTEKLKKTLFKNKDNYIFDHYSSKDNFNAYLFNRLEKEKLRFCVANLNNDQRKILQIIFKTILIEEYKIGTKKYLFLLSDDGFSPALFQQLNEFTKLNQLTVSISNTFFKTQNMYEYFMQANQLSYHSFIEKSGHLLVGSANSVDTTVLKRIFNELIQTIDSKYLQGIENILNSLPLLFIKQNYTMTHVVWFYNALVGQINIAYNLNDSFPFSPLDVEDLVTHFQTFDNLCTNLLLAIKEMVTPHIPTNTNSNELWKKISEYIEKNYTKKIQVSDICNEFFISAKTLYNITMANTNKSYLEYLTFFRLEKAKKLLRTTPMTVVEVAEKVGIKDQYYLNRIFKKHTGITPLQYKNEGSPSDNNE